MKSNKLWFVYTIIVVIAWGVWGALSKLTINARFPDTLVYVVWAITMIPPALVALHLVGWKLEYHPRAIALGSAAGLLGAGGQLVLFKVLAIAPAHLIFSFIALSPLVTILMALVISREKTTGLGWAGIALAIVAGAMLPYETPKEGGGGITSWTWVGPALIVLAAWGIQGFVISHANRVMSAESIFFYMMLTSLLVIPVALYMTDFKQDINWGFKGPYLSAMIQVLNAAGALLLVYAFRFGKAIIVAPLANAGAPVITIILSLLMFKIYPNKISGTGIVLAIVATVLMALDDGVKSAKVVESTPAESKPAA